MANHNITVYCARNGTFNQQQITFCINAYNFQMLNSRLRIAILTSHAFTGEHATGVLCHTDRTGNTVRT